MHLLRAQRRSGGRDDLRCSPCLTPPSPVPPSPGLLAQGPAGEGVVLPAGAERVRREKPPCSNESAHSAAARRMITRRAGGRRPGPRAACAAAPRARSPRLSAANRTLSAVTEAGGSRRPSPAPATRRVTRKHGAAPLPRPPSPRSRLPPRTSSRPRGFCSSNALLSARHHYASSRFSAAPRVSFPFVFRVYRKRLLLSRALVKPNLWWQRKAVRAGRGPGILAAADQSVVETSLAGFPATPPSPPPARLPSHTQASPPAEASPFSPERPQRSRKEVWVRGTVARGGEPRVRACEPRVVWGRSVTSILAARPSPSLWAFGALYQLMEKEGEGREESVSCVWLLY